MKKYICKKCLASFVFLDCPDNGTAVDMGVDKPMYFISPLTECPKCFSRDVDKKKIKIGDVIQRLFDFEQHELFEERGCIECLEMREMEKDGE